jgi:hypothetical protein
MGVPIIDNQRIQLEPSHSLCISTPWGTLEVEIHRTNEDDRQGASVGAPLLASDRAVRLTWMCSPII